MSRVSSTAKRYAGPSYTSHYSSYSSSLTPGLSSYGERDRLSSYKSPTSSSSTSSSGYSSSSYLSSSAVRSRNYSTSSDPDRDRGRTIPRTDILGSSSSSSSSGRTSTRSPRVGQRAGRVRPSNECEWTAGWRRGHVTTCYQGNAGRTLLCKLNVDFIHVFCNFSLNYLCSLF